MRDELRNHNWHVHDLTPDDIRQTYNTFMRSIKALSEITHERLKQMKENSEDEEYISDVAYYGECDIELIRESFIVRVIGVFEGILIHNFPECQNKFGLKKKIEAILNNGYEIYNLDKLNGWIHLRNALSHNPPKWPRFTNITDEDIYDLSVLLFTITTDLLERRT